MAIQNECDVCGESWPVDCLILVEYTNKITCPACINELINALAKSIEVWSNKAVNNNIVWHGE